MMKTESISAQNRESLRQLRRRLVREQRAVSIRKFFRNKLSVVGMVLVLLMLICAVFAPLITGLLGVDPYTATMQERFQAPSVAHLFGTDNLGRDIFARVLYGAQISMTVGFTVGLLSALIGTALGLYASVNKVLDNVLMRLCDGLKAIPNILLAITLMAVLPWSLSLPPQALRQNGGWGMSVPLPRCAPRRWDCHGWLSRQCCAAFFWRGGGNPLKSKSPMTESAAFPASPAM